MIGDWGRRYFVALQTREGRNKVATVYLMVAVVVNLVATALPLAWPNANRIGPYLLGIGTGLLIVSIVNFILNRSAE
jgi:hypothetical protein